MLSNVHRENTELLCLWTGGAAKNQNQWVFNVTVVLATRIYLNPLTIRKIDPRVIPIHSGIDTASGWVSRLHNIVGRTFLNSRQMTRQPPIYIRAQRSQAPDHQWIMRIGHGPWRPEATYFKLCTASIAAQAYKALANSVPFTIIIVHHVHNWCTQRVSSTCTSSTTNVQTLTSSLPLSLGYTSAAILSTAFVLIWQSTVVAGARKRAGIEYPQGKYSLRWFLVGSDIDCGLQHTPTKHRPTLQKRLSCSTALNALTKTPLRTFPWFWRREFHSFGWQYPGFS